MKVEMGCSFHLTKLTLMPGHSVLVRPWVIAPTDSGRHGQPANMGKGEAPVAALPCKLIHSSILPNASQSYNGGIIANSKTNVGCSSADTVFLHAMIQLGWKQTQARAQVLANSNIYHHMFCMAKGYGGWAVDNDADSNRSIVLVNSQRLVR